MNRSIRFWESILIVFAFLTVSCKNTPEADERIQIELPSDGLESFRYESAIEESPSSLFDRMISSDSDSILDELPDASRPAFMAAAVPYDDEIPYELSLPYGSGFADFLEDISWPFWIAVLGIVSIVLLLVLLIVKLLALIVSTITESCKDDKSPERSNCIEKEEEPSQDYFAGPKEGSVNCGSLGMEFKIYEYQFHGVSKPDFYRIAYRFSGTESMLVSGPISKKRAFEVILWNQFFEEKLSARELLTQLGYGRDVSLDVDYESIQFCVKVGDFSRDYRCMFFLLSDSYAFYNEAASLLLHQIESRVSKENAEEEKEKVDSLKWVSPESSPVQVDSQQNVGEEEAVQDFDYLGLGQTGTWSEIPDFPEDEKQVGDLDETAQRARCLKDALLKKDEKKDGDV